MRRPLTLILYTFLVAAPSRAAGPAATAEGQAPRRLGLRDALAIAVRQNPTLASRAIDVAIADANILQAEGMDDFLLDAGVNWLSSRTDPVTGQPFQQTALDNLRLTTGIHKPLSDGGLLGLRFDGDYTRTISRVEFGTTVLDTESEVYAPKLRLEFNQPFLRGFGEDVARAPRRRAKIAREVTLLQREVDAANVVRDVIHAYWELAYAAEDLEIRRASLALAQEQLRIVQASIQAGRLAPAASAEVEATMATREEEVLVAEVALAERSLDVRLLSGMEIGPGEMTLVAVDRPEPATRPTDLDASLKSAMEQNPQLKTVRAQGKSATIEVEVAENGLLPQLDFNAAAGPAGNAENPRDAFEQLAKFDSYSVNAGLVFQTPIGRRTAKGALAAAHGGVRKVRLSEADLQNQIAVQVVRASNLIRSSQKRIDVLVKAAELAQVNLRSEKARFDVGRSTNFDVLMRQDELAQAQLRQARAKTDYLKSMAILEALTGEILGRYGIEVTPR